MLVVENRNLAFRIDLAEVEPLTDFLDISFGVVYILLKKTMRQGRPVPSLKIWAPNRILPVL